MSCAAKWLALCAALALGEACGFAASRYAAAWPAAAAALCAIALLLYGAGARGLRLFLTFSAGLLLSLHAAHLRNEAVAEATWRSSGTPFARVFRVEGDPRVTPERNGIRWASFPCSAGPLKVRAVVPLRRRVAPPVRGEEWECAGWLSRARYDSAGSRRMLWVKGRGTYARRVPSRRGAFAALVASVRAELSRRMCLGLDRESEAAALNRAILLGERSRIPKEERDAFAAAGTIHVFAISGLHVVLVAETLALVLALLGVPGRATGLLLAPALWMYVAVTGFSPSAVRAAAMYTMSGLAPVFWRRPDGLVAWSVTFLAVYALDPMKLYDVGCALSFAVMLGIVFWGRFTADFVKSRALAAVVMSLAAWAVGTPIAAHAFGRVTPGGIMANLALIPAAGASVKAALAGVFASFLSERLAAHVNNLAALVTKAMAGLSRAVASVPGANVEVEPWSVAACVAWYAALALLLFLLRSRLSRRRRTI
ncbi:MAG: ComEC/Rec2 family competence protein [Kiritimatiellae bacterium]|nr:ComEC/Rec2 family competence protein [Kiritimatiellia bacterium]